MPSRLLAFLVVLLLSGPAGRAGEFFSLEGHGGPVRAIAVSPDGHTILTASFDTSVGLWRDGTHVRWLEAHEAAATAVAFVGPERAVSGGDDGALFLWDLETGTPRLLGRHAAKIAGLAVSPDGSLVASASWDGTIGLWPLAPGAAPRHLEGHRGPVNAVAFAPSGDALYSASADGTLRRWSLENDQSIELIDNGFGINVLAIDPGEDWLVYGALDGVTHVLDLDTGEVLRDFTLGRRPILAMALEPRHHLLAIGDGKGYITLVETRDWAVVADFRAALKGPIWALAITPDGENVLAGGLADTVHAFPVDGARAAPKLAMADSGPAPWQQDDSPGARLFRRTCAICHTLEPDGKRRAGPTLYGLFGRPVGAVPGYRYSEALQGRDIIWTEETIDALFDLGPDRFLPGTKMPMQRIPDPAERRALIAWLRAHAGQTETMR